MLLCKFFIYLLTASPGHDLLFFLLIHFSSLLHQCSALFCIVLLCCSLIQCSVFRKNLKSSKKWKPNKPFLPSHFLVLNHTFPLTKYPISNTSYYTSMFILKHPYTPKAHRNQIIICILTPDLVKTASWTSTLVLPTRLDQKFNLKLCQFFTLRTSGPWPM